VKGRESKRLENGGKLPRTNHGDVVIELEKIVLEGIEDPEALRHEGERKNALLFMRFQAKKKKHCVGEDAK
jgi:hypothetical protein